jgi:hypothetical protein
MTQTEQIIIIELSPLDANLINFVLSRSKYMNKMEKDASEKFILQTTMQTSDETFNDVILTMNVRAQLHNLGIKTGI